MTERTTHLSRRDVLRTTGAVAVLGTAGCLGGDSGRPENVELPPPDNYEALQDADLPYPIYGEELPDVTVPDVLRDHPVSTADLHGDSHLLLTFVYTRCEGICLNLASNLVHVQARAAEAGFTDDIDLTAISFDPKHDTPERFQEWGKARGLDYDLDNCYLLRPESPERAKEVVEDTYGEAYEHNEGAGMAFLHTGLILLVNDQGVVERSYAGDPPQPTVVIEDVESLVGV